MQVKELPRLISKNGASGIEAKRQRSKARAASSRDFTYTVVIDCEDGSTSQLVYQLRGNSGSYVEDWCGAPLRGTLEHVEDIVFDLDGISVPGFVYNGTDDAGIWGYFFSSDEVPEVGGFIVLIGDQHVAGQPYNPFTGFVATRTAP